MNTIIENPTESPSFSINTELSDLTNENPNPKSIELSHDIC